MNKLSDLIARGLVDDPAKDFLTIPKISIEDVINKPVALLNVHKNISTVNGDNRFLLHLQFIESYKEVKVFTNSKILKMQIDALPANVFPVECTIVKYRDGNKQYYKLT